MRDRKLRIHGARGVVERVLEVIAERSHRHERTGMQTPVTEIMTRQVVCAYADLALDTLLEVMVQERLGCIPVITEGCHPIGMVTKADIVEFLAAPQAMSRPVVADVMMPLAITLDDRATVAHAAMLMSSEDMHHVMIVSERCLVGVVSTMDVTRWVARNNEVSPS